MNDEHLAFALQNAVGHPAPFDDSELANVKTLDVVLARDLSGIEKCTALETLRFFASRATTVEALGALKSLEVLKIGCVPITDLSPLKGLMNLHTLTLKFTLVTDASPLFALASLKHVELNGDPWDDASYARLKKAGFTLSPESHWRLTRTLVDGGFETVYGANVGVKPALVAPKKGLTYEGDYVELSEKEVEALLRDFKGDAGSFFNELTPNEPTGEPIEHLLG